MRFVDSSYWIGLQVPRDARHHLARELWRGLSHALFTTEYVLGETWTFLRRRAGHEIALAFLDRMRWSPVVRVVHVNEELERESWAWLRRHDERVYSFVDATSFAVMQRLAIYRVASFDAHFAIYRFGPDRRQAFEVLP